jgi:hypothetical protein
LEWCEELGTALISRLMPYAAKIQLTSARHDELALDANGRTVEVRAAERAKIILGLAARKARREIA